MEQVIRKVDNAFILVIFTWIDDCKVFVKYYNSQTLEELDETEYRNSSYEIDKTVDKFFEENPTFTKWSY